MFVFLQGTKRLHFVLIAGQPIKEPVFQHGNVPWFYTNFTLDLTLPNLSYFELHYIHDTLVSTIPPRDAGPFVMNSQQELFQAMEDYSEGKNGFEGAPEWASMIGRSSAR